MYDAYDLFNGTVPVEDFGEAISKSADELDQVFASRPETERGALEVLERAFSSPIDASTWPLLEAGLVSYLGRNSAYFVFWATLFDPDTRLLEVDPYAPARVVSFLRSILGLYRGDLERTFTAFTEFPNDWRYINREVLFDNVNRRHVVRISLDQHSGDRFVLEAKAHSFLEFTRLMVETLRWLPNVFTPEQVAPFADAVEDVTELLRLGAEGTSPGSATSLD